MPDAVRDAESYAATKAHELTHWTKHPSRLDRDFGGKRFGDTGYAREEIVTELGAAFVCADLGITPEPRDDHASYLAHWLEILREDKRAIFSAATHVQRAVDFLHSLSSHEGATPEPAVNAAEGAFFTACAPNTTLGQRRSGVALVSWSRMRSADAPRTSPGNP